jgi:hypothetical protein
MMSTFTVTPYFSVIPAQAGIQMGRRARQGVSNWIPAFAGMTGEVAR